MILNKFIIFFFRKIKFNPTESKAVILAKKAMVLRVVFKIGDKEVEQTKYSKYLCVTLSKDLNWSINVSSVAGREGGYCFVLLGNS